MQDLIYDRPADYDLEHEDDDEDVRFFVELVRRMAPRRLVELGAGSGRVTVPLATLAAERQFDVVAVDQSQAMLEAAAEKIARLEPHARDRVRLMDADMRRWRTSPPADVIVVPCSTVSHFLDLDEQLAVWRCAFENLVPGGRFVVDVAMPNLAAFGDSLQQPPRALVEIDGDTTDAEGQRLLRYKTTVYAPHEQRADIRFLYDKFAEGRDPDRYLSDFASHVYFPREIELLFRHTGFVVEQTFGDYRFRRLRATSRTMVFVGRRP